MSYAIVRDLPSSFTQCVTSVDNTNQPINIELAKKQHDDYVNIIKQHVDYVIEVPTDNAHPDCCFVEDNAVVVQDKAIINFLGAESRRNEVSGIENALRQVPIIKTIVKMHDIDPEATLDGGDVLYTGNHLFVGLSDRTNLKGAECLVKVFSEKCPVYIFKGLLKFDALHFKCITTKLDDRTLLLTDNEAGKVLLDELKEYTGEFYDIIKIPEQVPSNILSLKNGEWVVYQQDFPNSEKVIIEEIQKKRKANIISLCMSEFIKADGALTCCSILI